jgi:hypothetical protein
MSKLIKFGLVVLSSLVTLIIVINIWALIERYTNNKNSKDTSTEHKVLVSKFNIPENTIPIVKISSWIDLGSSINKILPNKEGIVLISVYEESETRSRLNWMPFNSPIELPWYENKLIALRCSSSNTEDLPLTKLQVFCQEHWVLPNTYRSNMVDFFVSKIPEFSGNRIKQVKTDNNNFFSNRINLFDKKTLIIFLLILVVYSWYFFRKKDS